jgi:hypothetical protein
MAQNSQTIQVYDNYLVCVKKIGQMDPNLAFFIPDYVEKVEVSDDYFVFKDNGEIVLMDEYDGWVKTRFRFDGDDFLLDSATNRILVYNNESSQVVSYDFEGKSKTMRVSKSSGSFKLVDCWNGKLLFLDSVSKSLCKVEIKSNSRNFFQRHHLNECNFQ